MKFKEVADYFQQIEDESSRLEITRMLAELLKKATGKEASIIANLSLGKLHPPYIGTQFAMAEKNLVKVIADVLGIDETEIKKQAKKLGDLGLVVETGNWRPKGDLSVTDVYRELCNIEEISGTGSVEKKITQLSHLLSQLNPLAAKFVVRIVLGKLRLGFSDMTLVDALSWMEIGNKTLRPLIESAYNTCADIGLIAKELKGAKGVDELEKKEIHVGIPIRMAAAERLPTAKAIFDKIGECVAQPKLDGFRLQIHVDKTGKEPQIHFYSRNLQDMSYMFPDLKKALKNLKVKTLICEGEAIVYDPNTGTFMPFQETVKRKRKHGIKQAMEDFPLQLFVFDVLYLNGQDLLNQTQAVRRQKLIELFEDFKPETVKIIEEQKIGAAKELEEYFTKNIASGLEGLVVKRTTAVYQPGKRNFNWIKLKRHEGGQLEDTIDCVILGYYAGTGKRTAFGIGALLVGVYNKKEDAFQTIAKIGTGLTDAQWKEVKKKCDEIAVKKQPKNVFCPKELIPDVWTSPEIVCAVFADEITMSPMHTAGKTNKQLGFALRFPRFLSYRPDKSPEEATTVSEVSRMYDDQYISK